jgi:hypothetical protein
MNNVPSKYIKRLRILTDEMCNTNDKILLKELKQIIELSQSEISKKITLKSKLIWIIMYNNNEIITNIRLNVRRKRYLGWI